MGSLDTINTAKKSGAKSAQTFLKPEPSDISILNPNFNARSIQKEVWGWFAPVLGIRVSGSGLGFGILGSGLGFRISGFEGTDER